MTDGTTKTKGMHKHEPLRIMSDHAKSDTKGTVIALFIKGVLPLIILLGIWQLIAALIGTGSLLEVANAFIRLSTQGDPEGRLLIVHTIISLYRVGLGFFVAVITAIPLGIAMGRYRFAESVVSPVMEAMRPIPPIAWIPMALLLFGNLYFLVPQVTFAQIFIIWIGAFFPILLNTIAGVKRTDPVHLEVVRTFGANEIQILRKVVIPSAAPEVFAGLRIGFGIGWMCLVAAEIIGKGLGLGYLIDLAYSLGLTGEMISGMLVIGVIGFIISFAFLIIEKQLLVWRREVSI
jgi:NitT/TauT family transport system permease protein